MTDIEKVCRTCMYWKHERECDMVDSWTNKDKGRQFEMRVSADDDSNLQSALITGPEFGCVLHAPK